MPTTMRTAAVEHCVGRGNGSVLVTGVKMAQQLEKATTNYYCLYEHVAGIHYTNCHNRVLKLDAQHCLSHIRSLLRLRGAAGRPGRNRRLRAQTETRMQMPILRPVNSLGIRSARNIMNYAISRFDIRRTIPRRAIRAPPGKIGISRHRGTSHRCSLGSITRSMLRRPVRPGYELRISSSLLGLPRLFFYRKENRSSRLNVSAEPASAGMSLTRRSHENRQVGTAIASSPTHCRLATCDRVRRPAQRFSAIVCGHNQSMRTGTISLRAHALTSCALSVVASPAAYSKRHACWTAGARASVAPGSPAVTFFLGTAGRLQSILARNCLVTRFTANLERYAYWTAGARASVSPGSPVEFARSALLDLRLHRLRLCSTSSAVSLCHVTPGQLQRSSARNCCVSNSESHSYWTAGARASVSPGSPIGLALSLILDLQSRRLRFCLSSSAMSLCLETPGRRQCIPARNCLVIFFTLAGRPVRAKAFRQVHQLGSLWQLTTIELGIASMEPFMTSLPLLPVTALASTPEGSTRQSVGSHGDNT
jgi:hypothetical protein